MRIAQRSLVAVLALGFASVSLAVVSPAQAAPSRAGAAAAAPCRGDSTARTGGNRSVPHWRKNADTAQVSQSDLEALPASQTRPKFVARTVSPRLADIVNIPVYVHAITGRHKGERKKVSRDRIRNLIAILNNAMAGRQSSLSAPARFRFSVVRVDRRRKESWYKAFFNGPRDQKMKRRLHRGDAHALNLYLNGGGPRDDSVLGWSRFPWQYATTPRLDSVSLNVASLPGGRARGYNLGDTLVHETGHWLGLFHTFEGGCDEPGDMVADTPAEGEPSFYCPTTRDSCTAPGLDPVRNFMDYSLDSCMNMFTKDQVLRMDSAFEKYRL